MAQCSSTCNRRKAPAAGYRTGFMLRSMDLRGVQHLQTGEYVQA